METKVTAPRKTERDIADRIYFTLALAMAGLIGTYFILVPIVGLNLAFHFYLMLWITMASSFNVAAGFSGYMPFGYVAFYGVGAFTTAILVFIFAWNDFLFANTLTSTDNAQTVPAALAFFSGGSKFTEPIGAVAAAAVVVTVPIIIMVLIFQRRIVAGLTSGAVKG